MVIGYQSGCAALDRFQKSTKDDVQDDAFQGHYFPLSLSLFPSIDVCVTDFLLQLSMRKYQKETKKKKDPIIGYI